MAGMFYSLEEVAKKLGKNEEEIKEIVRQGRLREFRDGANSLFKIDEVEALMVADTALTEPSEVEISDIGQIDDFAGVDTGDGQGEVELSSIDDETSLEPKMEDDLSSLESDSEQLSLAPEEDQQDISIDHEMSEDELAMLAGGDTDHEDFSDSLESDINLEPEIGSPSESSSESDQQLSQADTIASDQDLNLAEETSNLDEDVLSATDQLGLAADSQADQILSDEQAGESLDDLSLASTGQNSFSDDTLDFGTASAEKSDVEGDSLADLTDGDEASLEEIEDDVNLDSFGSGSGLLDLSLQADDTSLGGILDDIYTPEGDESTGSAGGGSVMDVAAEADQLVTDSGSVMPAMATGYVEPEPDTMSNALGYSMALPLLAIIYTAIVAVAALNGITVPIMSKVDSMIWYIMVGVAVAAISIVGVAFMMSGSGLPKEKKAKKIKEKKPKAKKEKKPKKPKKEKKTKK